MNMNFSKTTTMSICIVLIVLITGAAWLVFNKPIAEIKTFAELAIAVCTAAGLKYAADAPANKDSNPPNTSEAITQNQIDQSHN